MRLRLRPRGRPPAAGVGPVHRRRPARPGAAAPHRLRRLVDGPLRRDLATAYAARLAGAAPDWAELPVQYADYAAWQREQLGTEDDPSSVIAQQSRYWRAALSGLPDELALPRDRSRSEAAGQRGETLGFSIGADVHERVSALGRRTGTTAFMVLQAAWPRCSPGWARARTSPSAPRSPDAPTTP
ncbi:hypothetical protein GXW82_10440 [Streptacidiphilus sp. 4-A2]|nr:hypothetical protein [Streptacidiphilus sp. 4-A2]